MQAICRWLWLTLVVIAPIGEETLFRGFLFRGWYRVPLDVWPVIIVTSSIWALSHVQYDLFHGCEGTHETLMACQH
jgi:uncharacterized protein